LNQNRKLRQGFLFGIVSLCFLKKFQHTEEASLVTSENLLIQEIAVGFFILV